MSLTQSEAPADIALLGHGVKGRGWPPRVAPLQGRQFRSQMYFYYTNRGTPIYLALGGNTPFSATGGDIQTSSAYRKVGHFIAIFIVTKIFIN